MKNIAVYFSSADPMGHPLSTPDYWTSYTELTDAINKHGGQLYIVRTQSSYLGNGVFSNSWIIEGQQLKQTGQVTVDVVLNKGRFQSDNTVPVFNCSQVTEICLDKWKMYTELKELCPLSFFVEKQEDLLSAIEKVTTSRVVFKPVKGGEGVGVKIEERDYFVAHLSELQYPGVVSNFLDTSGGVPGIVDGLHDLRVALFDGEILYSYYRTPPTNSFLANVSKGGKFEMIPLWKLPNEIVAVAKEIDATLSDCKHRFYSIDFGYTSDGPKIIEMNSELGLLPNKDDAVFITLKEKLAAALMDM
ncbi:MAG: hypothetical protein QG639_1032 [Patescibacteria group bacterium]|jgi:glutathione synthase/RimK-type ligase-like ATP-grasp enzyme|nr:hypothetical protein [Patescibacteria group bacterium]